MARKLDVGVVVKVIASGYDERTIGMIGTVIEYSKAAENSFLARIFNIGPWLVDLPQMRNLLCNCGKHQSEGRLPFHSHEIVPIDDPDKQEETLEDVILELEKVA